MVRQQMVLHDGTPKGMKLVLQECGVDVKGDMTWRDKNWINFQILPTNPPFLKNYFEVEDIFVLYLPKYHCELNPIEIGATWRKVHVNV